MSFLIPIPSSLLCSFLFFLFSIVSFFDLSLANPRITEAGVYCGTSPSISNTHFIPNFIKELKTLSELILNQNWGTHSFGLNPTTYILSQCMDDLSPKECYQCFAESQIKVTKCLSTNSARVYLDGCFFRYDKYNFFEESIDREHDKVLCNSPSSALFVENYYGNEITKKANEAIMNSVANAARKGGFGVAEVKGGAASVYALAQCWKTVNESGCKTCLEKAGQLLRTCMPGTDGRGLNPGCYLRYSTEMFYNDGAEEINEKSARIAGVITVALGSVAFSLLSLFGAYVGYTKLKMTKEEHNNLIHLSSSIYYSKLNFKYELLEKATRSFDPSRKLGQGGGGSVFKGNLPDGRTVAVKRLCFNTRTWVDEFFNEVNLVRGIQHKNLVQLLGCSIEGPESLLVYEFLPNSSLDQILFDKNKIQILSWEQRFDIIIGAAEGLAYLHGGSQTRIIHRDIKCSNILLDENMTAKIADFGLVRRFAADKTHLSTGIAGTLGYMAPEYLVRGQLTEKADVYSYGVVVIEIICGRRNNVFMQESGSILHSVWMHYKLNSLQESVDSCLREEFPVKEASNVLQIALLCTQASCALRPSMSEVVQMLTEKDYKIPRPKQPPFLNSSVLDSDSSTISSGTVKSATIELTNNSVEPSSISHSESNEPVRVDVSKNR